MYVPSSHLSLFLFHHQALGSFPLTDKVIFPLFVDDWFPLVSCPTKSQPKSFCFSRRRTSTHHHFVLNYWSFCFPKPATSRPNLFLHRKQPWAQSAVFRTVHFGLETQANRQVQFSTVEIPCEFQISSPRVFRIIKLHEF
jgi:hypothetical protein